MESKHTFTSDVRIVVDCNAQHVANMRMRLTPGIHFGSQPDGINVSCMHLLLLQAMLL